MSTRQRTRSAGTRWAIVAAILIGAAANAADFDERIRAPRAATAAELKSSVRDYLSTYEAKKAAPTPGAFIRDPAAHKKLSDAGWLISQCIDEGVPLGDLSEFGLQRGEDGSYSVRTNEHPEWLGLDRALLPFRDPSTLEVATPRLKQRGFRDADIATLKNFIESDNWQEDELGENKSLLKSFGSKAQARKQAKQSISRDEVISFVYQRDRAVDEARRRWAVRFLDSLDNQRQRVLISYVYELEGLRAWAPPPAEPKKHYFAQVDQVLQDVLSGKALQAVEAEEQRVRQ